MWSVHYVSTAIFSLSSILIFGSDRASVVVLEQHRAWPVGSVQCLSQFHVKMNSSLQHVEWIVVTQLLSCIYLLAK